MNSQQHLKELVHGLVAEGHKEVAVIKLPSQAKKQNKTLWVQKNRKSGGRKVSAMDRVR